MYKERDVTFWKTQAKLYRKGERVKLTRTNFHRGHIGHVVKVHPKNATVSVKLENGVIYKCYVENIEKWPTLSVQDLPF